MNLLQPLAPPPVSGLAVRRGRLSEGLGPRFLLLLFAGLAWIVPALWDRHYLYGILTWDVLLVLAWYFDRESLPEPEKLLATRSIRDSLSLGVENHAQLEVRNTGRRALWLKLLDHQPPALVHELPQMEMTIAAGDTQMASYRFTPRERGDHGSGDLYLRYRSMLGLAERWAVVPLRQALRIYPNFEHARKHSLYLARSRQIELQMRLTRLRGQGSEFESLRDYRETDEARAICWTATARRGKLVSRTWQVERSQAVWAVLDCGRLMRTRTEGYSKLDRAVDATLCLAQLALYSGDRFGVLAYGRNIIHRLLPARGPAHLRQVLETLSQLQEEVPEADHVRASAAVLGMQKQRGLVVWITDLAETAMNPEVIEAASQLTARHLLAFVMVAQPELRRKGAELPESVEQMYEVAAAQELVTRREMLLGRLRERGALAMETLPGNLTTAVLNQYLQVKEKNLI